MPARPHRSPRAAVLATIGALACAPASSPSYREASHTAPIPSMTAGSRVINAERIARSGSQTALDAVRAFVPRHRLQEIGFLDPPIGVSSSALSRGTMRIILDGQPVADLELLRAIPASQVLAIHVLSGSDAAIRFGPSYDGGAIVLQTWLSLRER
jgi:hypothetical protein